MSVHQGKSFTAQGVSKNGSVASSWTPGVAFESREQEDDASSACGEVVTGHRAEYLATVRCLCDEALLDQQGHNVVGLRLDGADEYAIARAPSRFDALFLKALLDHCEVVVFDSARLGLRVAVFPQSGFVATTSDFDAMFSHRQPLSVVSLSSEQECGDSLLAA